MENVVELATWRYSVDWNYCEKVSINLDEWAYFEAQYRIDSWHLIGHKYVKNEEKWVRQELSAHWCNEGDIAEFIYAANEYGASKFPKKCMVSSFTNMHDSVKFYESLRNVLERVKKLEQNTQDK